MLADHYQKDVWAINEHFQNVYDERELEPQSTIRESRIVQKERALGKYKWQSPITNQN